MDIYKTLMKNKSLMEDALDEKIPLDYISTGVINLNLAFSGKVDGGIPMGKVSQMASLSSLGKTFVGMSILKNALKKGCIVVYIDTENSFDFSFAKKCGIDTSSKDFFAYSINAILEVQKKILDFTKDIPANDRKNVVIFLDSFGNLQTPATLAKAEKGDEKKDMTPAVMKNNLSRILAGTRATIFVANHLYDNIGGFGDPIKVPGGKVLRHNCTSIVVGSSKAKVKTPDGKILGNDITINIDKSRLAIENSTLKFRINRSGGLDIFWGLLDDALEHGCIVKDGSKFVRPDIDKEKFWEKEIYKSKFWLPVFNKTDFGKFLENKYTFREDQELDITKTEISEELNKNE